MKQCKNLLWSPCFLEGAEQFHCRVTSSRVLIFQNYRKYTDGVLKNKLKFEFHFYLFVSVNHSIYMNFKNKKHLENDLKLLCTRENTIKSMNNE